MYLNVEDTGIYDNVEDTGIYDDRIQYIEIDITYS